MPARMAPLTLALPSPPPPRAPSPPTPPPIPPRQLVPAPTEPRQRLPAVVAPSVLLSAPLLSRRQQPLDIRAAQPHALEGVVSLLDIKIPLCTERQALLSLLVGERLAAPRLPLLCPVGLPVLHARCRGGRHLRWGMVLHKEWP